MTADYQGGGGVSQLKGLFDLFGCVIVCVCMLGSARALSKPVHVRRGWQRRRASHRNLGSSSLRLSRLIWSFRAREPHIFIGTAAGPHVDPGVRPLPDVVSDGCLLLPSDAGGDVGASSRRLPLMAPPHLKTFPKMLCSLCGPAAALFALA